jgi:F-type H+-transporting ATPase subunit gamma
VLLAARRRARELEAPGGVPILVVIGRRGTNAFRYAGRTVEQSIGDVDEATPYTRWNEVMSGIMARFESREIDTVEVVSMRYRTRAVQEAAVTPVLPFVVESRSPAAPGAEPLYKVEPSQESFLGEAVALAVRSELTCMLVEALLSEQIQRTMAMHNATDSAEGMAKKLTRAYNRARQAQVTAEMMEIVGGSQRAVEE